MGHNIPELLRQKGFTLKISILTALLVALYYPTIVKLVSDWSSDGNYSHGFLVPLISAYLVWERRDKLLSAKSSPGISGLFLLIFGVLVLIVGHAGVELFLQRFSILLVLAGLILFLQGKAHLRICFFPLAFLIFMIPIPQVAFNAVAFPMQLFAARIATDLIQLIGIPAFREGNMISLAYTNLEVAQACSGIRSLITIMTLATVYAYFLEKKRWKQVVLVLCAIPIAIITNSARITVTAVLSHYVGVKSAQGFYHSFEGWFMFLVAFGILVAWGFVLRRFFNG